VDFDRFKLVLKTTHAIRRALSRLRFHVFWATRLGTCFDTRGKLDEHEVPMAEQDADP
jgi:hypothetical protein